MANDIVWQTSINKHFRVIYFTALIAPSLIPTLLLWSYSIKSSDIDRIANSSMSYRSMTTMTTMTMTTTACCLLLLLLFLLLWRCARCEETNSQWLNFRKIENLGAARTQACKMQIQLVPALFCHNDMDVTLTFRKSELGVMKLSRNLSPNFHPESSGSVKLQNTNLCITISSGQWLRLAPSCS